MVYIDNYPPSKQFEADKLDYMSRSKLMQKTDGLFEVMKFMTETVQIDYNDVINTVLIDKVNI